MKILNIGPMELVFILIIVLIVLGPKDMVQYGRKLGKFIRDFVKSPLWRDLISTSREIQDFPKKIMRETELDKVLNEVEGSLRETAKETERIINDTQEKLTVNLPPKEKPEEKGEETAEQPGEESSEAGGVNDPEDHHISPKI